MRRIFTIICRATDHVGAQVSKHSQHIAKGIVWSSVLFISAALLFLSKEFAINSVKALQAAAITQHQKLPLPIIKNDQQPLPADGPYWRVIKVHTGDTPIQIFKKLGLNMQDLHDILALKQAQQLKHLHPGQELRFLITQNHQLKELIAPISLTDSIDIKEAEAGFSAKLLHREFEETLKYASININSSLSNDANKAGLPDKLIMALANIFDWDIDFGKDLRPGDHFSLLYKEYYLDGKKARNGEIVEAEFSNRGKIYKALRYTNAKGETQYYTPDGMSLQRPFLRTPVKYTRISSRFSLGRLHPILHRMRAHKGVDYAAPRGTPIRATSDGKITFIGKRGGYGNVIIIQHNAKYSTLYAHMNGFAKKLHKYSQVKQGQIIGFVGQTGLATGPHLHYEFRINGIHRNPLTVKLPTPHPIEKQYREQFKQYAKQMMEKVHAYRSTAT